MKIALQTVHKLLSEADDAWVDNQSAMYMHRPNLPPEEVFFESEWEDDSGLVFEYSAMGVDNVSAELEGNTLTLVGRDDAGEPYEFGVTLLRKWDAEKWLKEVAP